MTHSGSQKGVRLQGSMPVKQQRLPKQRSTMQQRLHMAWCIGGILGSLLLYGVLQERIMAEPFGGERFTHSLLLVLCNRLTTCAVSLIVLAVKGQDARPQAPLYAYAAVSLSNVVSTSAQYEALRYLTFPLQTLAKCAKMVPVMLWGAAINRKTYSLQDYGAALLITVGCALFPLTGSVSAKGAKQVVVSGGLPSHTFGAVLMVTYLAFDGFTSTWQDKLFRGTRMSIYNQSFYVTMVSAVLSFSGLLTSGQLLPAVRFVARHPEALGSMFALSMAATLGQLFITYTIRSYGALLFATAMTTRQFLSVLLSCLVFRHPLTPGQWVSTFLVFVTVYMRSFTKKRGALTRTKSRGLTEQLNRTISSGLGLKTSQAAVAAAVADVGGSGKESEAADTSHDGEPRIAQQAAAVENGLHDGASVAEEDANKTK